MATPSIQYYRMGHGPDANLARVKDEVEYAYLCHETGAWIQHPRVADRVTQSAKMQSLTLHEAQEHAKKLDPTLEPEWLDGVN
jgi:hypothetical protein